MKGLLPLLYCLMFPWVIHAQKLHLGIKAGVNLAYLSGYEEIAGDDIRTAHHYGIYGDIVFSEKLSLQTEVLFSSQGANYEDSEDFEDGETIFYTEDQAIAEYIIVPVMLKFYPVKGFSLQAGPQLGFLSTAKNKYKENGISREDDYEDFIKSTDFGLALGLGYKMGFGLNIDARYVHGISNILSEMTGIPADEDLNNQLIQFSLGYSFLH